MRAYLNHPFIKELIILALISVAAFVSVCFIYRVRQTQSTSFPKWMSAEGWTLFLFIWFGYGMVLLYRGFFILT